MCIYYFHNLCRQKKTPRAERLPYSQSCFDLGSGFVEYSFTLEFLLSFFLFSLWLFLLFCKKLILQNWGKKGEGKSVNVIILVKCSDNLKVPSSILWLEYFLEVSLTFPGQMMMSCWDAGKDCTWSSCFSFYDLAGNPNPEPWLFFPQIQPKRR